MKLGQTLKSFIIQAKIIPMLYSSLGEIYKELKLYKKAIEIYKEGLRAYPESFSFLSEIVDILIDDKNYDEALNMRTIL